LVALFGVSKKKIVVFIVCHFAAYLWQQVGVAGRGGVEHLDKNRAGLAAG